MANGADARVAQLTGRVVGLRRHRAAGLEAEAQAHLLAEGHDERDVHVVELVALDDGRAAGRSSSQSPVQLVEPVAVGHRLEHRTVGAPERLGFELQVLGQRQDDLLGARSGDLVVPVEDLLVDGDRGERGRVDLDGHAADDVGRRRHDGPARRGPGDDDRRGDHDEDARATTPARARTPAAGVTQPAEVVGGGPWGRNEPVHERTARAHDGQAAEQADLGPELVRLRRHQERAGDGHEEGEHDTADAPGRQRPRIRDHEEQEDEHLRRRDDHAPVVEPAHRRERPAGDHAVPGRGEQPDAGRQGDPERRRRGEQLEAVGDEHAADHDDGVRREHPPVERRPPEVERLDALAAEHDERHDETDVGRVEHVRSPVAHEVLRRQREPGDAGEHVPRVGAPVVARGSARHAQDQRHTAAGQHRARRPDEGPAGPERQGHLEDRAREDRGEDLRHADVEAQRGLTEDVDGHDDRRHVQARVAEARQHDRVRVRAERERPAVHVLPPAAVRSVARGDRGLRALYVPPGSST